MANPEHLAILKQGVEVWNKWREGNLDVIPDLSEANLGDANLKFVNLFKANLNKAKFKESNLMGANFDLADLGEIVLIENDLRVASFHKTNLRKAYFTETILYGAYFSEANLHKASFNRCNFYEADLSRADFSGTLITEADFSKANLNRADFSGAALVECNLHNANLYECILREANLERSSFIDADLTNADLSGAHVYGISAWDVNLTGAQQSNLVITPDGDSVITVDKIEIAQFVYLLLNNAKIRDVIDTIGKKAVLILGSFTPPERKEILEALKESLRTKNLVPIVFDFEKATERDFTETIKVLAGMSLFVIADITNPKSTPLELQATVPDYMIPFVPIIQKGEDPFAMFVDLQHKYRWVMEVRTYENKQQLINHLENGVIKPALEKHNELLALKNENLKIINIDEFSK